MLLISLAGSVVLLVCVLALPLFTKVQKEARIAALLIGVAWLSTSLRFSGVPFPVLGDVGISMCVFFAMRFGKEAWRNFDDRRMVERAEAYQAQIDAARSAT